MAEEKNDSEIDEAMLPLKTVRFQTDPKNQYVAGGFILCTVSMSIGTVLGFSAILLPQLEEENLINSKSHQASWIASLINIGQIFGSVLMGILAGMLGRKITIILSCIVLITSWAIIGFSNGSYSLLVVGRLLQGFGIMSSVSQIYLVEISDIQRRGTIAGCGPFAVSSGITFVYTLGAFLPWRWVCLVCAGLPGATAIMMPFLPETPNWLVHNGKIQEAEKALRWLRGQDADIQTELKMLKLQQKQSESNQESQASASKIEEKCEKIHPAWLAQEEEDLLDFELKGETATNQKTSVATSPNESGLKYTVSELMKPTAYKPFILLLATFVLQQSTGTFAVIFYAVNVFKDIGASGNPYVAAILTGIIRQLGTLVGALLMSRCPRKTLMVVSAFLMALSMLSLGLTVHYNEYLTKNAQQNSSDKIKRHSGDYGVDFKSVFSDTYFDNFKLQSNSNSQQNWNHTEFDVFSKNNFFDTEHQMRIKRDLQLSYNESDPTHSEPKPDKDVVQQILSILPLVEIVAYFMAFGLGVGTVPWLLLGELCPVQVKGLTSGVVVCTAYLTIFLVVKIFPSLVLTIGSHGVYYLFAAISMCMAIFSYCFVPETRGKTMQQIQNIFHSEKFGHNDQDDHDHNNGDNHKRSEETKDCKC